MIAERVVTRAGRGRAVGHADADPVTTEVVRHALGSAAEQMKRTLIRTAFSPVIYEVLDFAVALYDRRVRLLAQAPSLPVFMGRLSFCVEGAVEAAGGEEALEPGDVILYNVPYGTGSHPQDAALIAPVFGSGELLGYAAVKAHWLDIGGKEPYSTDTVDVFQEGTIFPGVKLVARGELVRDVYRTALANSRVPRMVAGDVKAEIAALGVGSAGLVSVVGRTGLTPFRRAVERMFDHGEAVVRSYLEAIPDGRYVGRGRLDDDGVSPEPVPFEVAVEVSGSDVRIDFSTAPATRPGPVNCPLPKTVAASRVALMMLAGAGEAPNEGHFRPLDVVTRPGTLFHPLPPAPTFVGGWPAFQAIEAIYQAVGRAVPEAVPASSGGDICSIVWWGVRERTGDPWADGSPHPVGQGAHGSGDGSSTLMHIAESATRLAPVEVWEARNPWLVEQAELAPDSGGPGRYRGGLGLDLRFRLLEDAFATVTIERTRSAPWGLAGGGEGRANAAVLELPDGDRRSLGKATRVRLPKGAVLDLRTGGGGGFGPPAERDPAALVADLREGYVTEAEAQRRYSEVLARTSASAATSTVSPVRSARDLEFDLPLTAPQVPVFSPRGA